MDEYNTPISLSRKEELLREELDRIRQTASFRFGNHIVRAIETPWRIILLPFTLPKLMLMIFLEHKTTRPEPSFIMRDCIVVFSSNSKRGLHYDRLEALLSHFHSSNTQLIHVSIDARNALSNERNVVRYMLSGRHHIKGMKPKTWNTKCETLLNCLFDIYAPKTFIFDGDYPFRGLLDAIKHRPEMNRFWIRESSNNHKISHLPTSGFEIFDAIIHPSLSKESDPDVHVGRSGSIFCNPIVHRTVSAYDAASFREKHLTSGGQLVFFDIGPDDPLADEIANVLLAQESVTLLVRNGHCSSAILNHPRCITLTTMRYYEALKASDAAVLYPDQYSIHTAFATNTPTLSILDSHNTARSLSEDLLTEELPLMCIDSTLDAGLMKTALQRIIDKEVQNQLAGRMSDFMVDYENNKLSSYLMDLHS